MSNVGFIGVGTMGYPMASNIVSKGNKLNFFDPFIQNEIFLTESQFARNRINLGLNIKFKKTPFVFKPSFILESNRKVSGETVSWSQKNIFVLALSIKI